MRNPKLNGLSVVLASLVGVLCTDCMLSSSSGSPSGDGGLGGASGSAGSTGYGGYLGYGGTTGSGGSAGAGGSTTGTCDSTLFDNGNIYACTNPTATSVFTLTSASTVKSLRLWTDTTISGQSITYTLLGPTGTTIMSGSTVKGGCDPYQTNWCEFLASPNVTLQPGTYSVKSSAAATCANSGSNNVGMVTVKGCAAAATCDSVLFDNGNVYACTNPTATSVFTLTSASTVKSLRLWANTTISGQSITYMLLGPTGTTLSSGSTTKGGCDPYQTNWCEFLVSMDMTLQAGTYTVKSSAAATCANSGSNNVGMVTVKGCSASVTPVDAGTGGAGGMGGAGGTGGAGGAGGASCTNPGPKCQALAACCPNITNSAAAKAQCEQYAKTCVENSCSIVLDGSLGIVYCRD